MGKYCSPAKRMAALSSPFVKRAKGMDGFPLGRGHLAASPSGGPRVADAPVAKGEPGSTDGVAATVDQVGAQGTLPETAGSGEGAIKEESGDVGRDDRSSSGAASSIDGTVLHLGVAAAAAGENLVESRMLPPVGATKTMEVKQEVAADSEALPQMPKLED